MAKTLKYKGTSHRREIDATAWRNVGVEDQNLVRWESDNNHTAEVTDAAAEYLLENEGDDFEVVEDSSTRASASRSKQKQQDARQSASGDS